MFRSFFPRPGPFFISVIVWAFITSLIWYTLGDSLGTALGFNLPAEDAPAVIGIGYFVTPQFLWFYCYYIFVVGVFSVFWFRIDPHPWRWWSIVGSSVILFSTYFSVQVAVAINEWRRPFFDSVQDALSQTGDVSSGDLYGLIVDFSLIAFVGLHL